MKIGKLESDKTCPECRGVCSMQTGGTALFRTVINPKYGNWNNISHTGDDFRKDFWVCAGCLGTGLRKDYLARLLSGDIKPC